MESPLEQAYEWRSSMSGHGSSCQLSSSSLSYSDSGSEIYSHEVSDHLRIEDDHHGIDTVSPLFSGLSFDSFRPLAKSNQDILCKFGLSPEHTSCASTDPAAGRKKTNLYKTELCRSWEETGSCRYRSKCQFAHGLDELRSVPRHHKWKTVPCRAFVEAGDCQYGKRCCFLHTTDLQQSESVKTKATSDKQEDSTMLTSRLSSCIGKPMSRHFPITTNPSSHTAGRDESKFFQIGTKCGLSIGPKNASQALFH